MIDTLTTSQKLFEGYYFSHLGIKKDEKITALHRSLVAKLPFLKDIVVSSPHFIREGDEQIVPAVFEYIKSFQSVHSGDAYWPHITLGAGAGDLHTTLPTHFKADTISLFQLGNFCTCRRKLGEWRLEGKKSNLFSISWTVGYCIYDFMRLPGFFSRKLIKCSISMRMILFCIFLFFIKSAFKLFSSLSFCTFG